jgi:signal peptidase I
MINRKTMAYVMLSVFFISVIGSVTLYFMIPKPSEQYRVLMVASISMEPTLMKGSVLVVDTYVSADEIVAAPYPNGDIICFHQTYGDELIVHRAIEKRIQNGTLTFVTKGDRNIGPDQPISANQLVGKVVNTNVPFVPMFLALVVLIVVAVVTGVLSIVLYSTRKKGSALLPSAQRI